MKKYFLNNALGHNNSLVEKAKILIKLSSYYVKLQWGTSTGQIFFKNKNTSEYSNLSYEKKKILNDIDSWIRSTIRKNHYNNHVDIPKNLGFEHIGYGCFVTRVFGRLVILTQGEATFFFVTDSKHNYILKVKFESVPRIDIKVTIEGTELLQARLPPLTERIITLRINSNLILNDITKIAISTEEFWSPYFIEKNKPNIPVGVGIERIELVEEI